jgi:hypothetical protein
MSKLERFIFGFILAFYLCFAALCLLTLVLILRAPKTETVATIRIVFCAEQPDPVKVEQSGTRHTFTFKDRRCAEWFASVLSGCFPVAESAPSIVEAGDKP